MDARSLRFVDIETIPEHENFGDMSVRKQSLFEKKFKSRIGKGFDYKNVDEAYKANASFLAEFNKVIAVSVGGFDKEGCLRIKNKSTTDEGLLINNAMESLATAKGLCAHYGKGFDYPVLSRKMLMYGLTLPPILNTLFKKPWDVNLFDTAEMWKFTDMKSSCSLDLLCEMLGVPSSKDGIDGSMVHEIFLKEGVLGLNKISKYCGDDVLADARCYVKLTQQPEITTFKFV